MDSGTIFNIIIVIAILVSVISKFRKRQSSEQSGESKKPSAWKQILQDIVSEIGREMDIGKAESTDSEDWEYIISQDRNLTPALKYGEITNVPPPIPVADERKKDRPERKKTDPQKIPQRPAHAKNFLQKAVVWSEILAPPVGLRK